MLKTHQHRVSRDEIESCAQPLAKNPVFGESFKVSFILCMMYDLGCLIFLGAILAPPSHQEDG